MRFIYVDFVNFINTLRYILPIDIDFENDIKIKISNFDNNSVGKKRICILGLSDKFIIVWNYIKKILNYKEIEKFKKIEYLNIEINNINKIKKKRLMMKRLNYYLEKLKKISIKYQYIKTNYLKMYILLHFKYKKI